MKNLIDERAATIALIAHPLEWRIRVVEEITVDAATHCLRRRSLQAAPLRALLAPFVSYNDREVLLALNIAPMPRGPLLDFSVTGPLGDAWLLPRLENSRAGGAVSSPRRSECWGAAERRSASARN